MTPAQRNESELVVGVDHTPRRHQLPGDSPFPVLSGHIVDRPPRSQRKPMAGAGPRHLHHVALPRGLLTIHSTSSANSDYQIHHNMVRLKYEREATKQRSTRRIQKYPRKLWSADQTDSGRTGGNAFRAS